jgi:hypothetical protein
MADVVKDRYWIVARDKPGLLRAIMQALAGDAHISFEGDLSRCSFDEELRPSPHETPALGRHTAYPVQDFVVLPLEAMTVQPILKVVLPDRRFMDDILHIQVERKGRLEFGSYDQFHPECIVCFNGVSTELLSRLEKSGVIRSWTEPYAGARRWHG